MRFAHEGIQHKTYLEAFLHYLHDWYVLLPLITVLGVATAIVATKKLSAPRTNENSFKDL